MPLYTVTREFQAELEEKKSRFLAFLVPYDRFETRLSELRDQHRKANHHVTAFRRMLDEGRIDEGAKDDGEPAGTSGMPMLKTMIGARLINCGIIVVRYFGGTKLGTGGLARAYSGAANAAINCAELEQWFPIKTKKVSVSFADTSELERRISLLSLRVLDRTFTEDGATLLIEGPEETLAQL
ncbi:IMPACT family protein [Pseudovibrio sp. SPO723]|uniref:IMPACT family protein n=1 Tax=Nesiotobacter zosterae TaxID=392721 RepID=UPI0029C5E04F|nr:YigZ family protein [Pseudovibrio sp. SPO723]MDX5594977.1 YigZ family protein [Pseudovibrio sp. SPO723]